MARKTWIKAVEEAASKEQTKMPWERGAPRDEMIARREGQLRKSA